MNDKRQNKNSEIKQQLLDKLKEEKAFWSYDDNAVTSSNIQDDQLIALTMRYLDLPEIKQLFEIFSYQDKKCMEENPCA